MVNSRSLSHTVWMSSNDLWFYSITSLLPRRRCGVRAWELGDARCCVNLNLILCWYVVAWVLALFVPPSSPPMHEILLISKLWPHPYVWVGGWLCYRIMLQCFSRIKHVILLDQFISIVTVNSVVRIQSSDMGLGGAIYILPSASQ